MNTEQRSSEPQPGDAAAGVSPRSTGDGPAAAGAVTTREIQRAMTPDQALARLKKGNERFVRGEMLARDLMAQVRATAAGQFPFAVVLTCIDSRVPPELIFDQGIGDVFSPRIAGNFASADIIGCIEYATEHAGAKLVVVLGHTDCGAVKAVCGNPQMGNLGRTLSNLRPAVCAVNDAQGPRDSKNKAFVQKVADENVRLTVASLTDHSDVLRALVARGQLKVVGAMYDVHTGRVSFPG